MSSREGKITVRLYKEITYDIFHEHFIMAITTLNELTLNKLRF